MAKAQRRGRTRQRQGPAAVVEAATPVMPGPDQMANFEQQVEVLKNQWEAGMKAQQLLQTLQADFGQTTAATSGPGMAALLGTVTSQSSMKLQLLKALSADEPTTATTLIDQQTKEAQEVVNLYSLVAAGIGLLPGMGLSFIGVFATQVLMIQKVAEAFGRDLSNSKTTTAITALLGTGFGEGVGGGLKALTFSAFPSSIGGVLGVVAGPVATYAACQAVGSVFISAFQNENRQEVTKGLAGQVQKLIGPSAVRKLAAA
jgi:uncharacterized protein (DUF697 family)